MIRNYLKIAYRNLWKNKVYSAINVFGLAMGMAVAIIIGLWVYDELSYDSYFPEKDKMAVVYQSQTFSGTTNTNPAIPRPLEFELRNHYNSYFKYISMCSWTNARSLRAGETTVNKTGNYIQPEGVEMLGLKILEGNKDGLDETHSIMLSSSVAKALFGGENPLGKVVTINNISDVKVTAVYEDIPFNNHFNDAGYLLPWDLFVAERQWVQESRDSWGNNSFMLFVQLADNQDMKTVSDKIAKVKYNASEDVQPFNPVLRLMPIQDIYLRSKFDNGVQVGGRIDYVWLFGAIGIFVLILACINFMNLSTARSEKRAKEVGIRKSVGSVKSQLVSQFLNESFLVVFLAFIIAIVLVLLFIEPYNVLVEKQMVFPWKSPYFWGISFIFILFTTLVSGSYPALYLSRFQPVKVLKGTFKAGKAASLPRKVLVVAQFSISVALIIGTLLVMHQINYTKNRPIGYDTKGIIQVPVMSAEYLGKFELIRNELLKTGNVTEASGSSSPSTEIWNNRSGFSWDGKPENFQEDFAWTEVTPEYIKSMGMEMASGRDFSREMATDSNAVLVNESFTKYVGIPNPIGLQLRAGEDEPLTVIGVVKDAITESPFDPVKQAVYAFNREGNFSYYNLRLNPEKSAHDNLAGIEAVFRQHFPNSLFEYQFIDEEYGKKFSLEERIGKGAAVFTLLAILISCLGLFGLASFVVEQRTKEIGIRKVMGASVSSLWAMLSQEFVLLVVISLFIAIPMAAYFMNGWLSQYSYRANMDWWIFALAAAGALSLTLATVSFQAIKAALMNPVESLRSE